MNRRQFLKLGAFSSAGIVLKSCIPSPFKPPEGIPDNEIISARTLFTKIWQEKSKRRFSTKIRPIHFPYSGDWSDMRDIDCSIRKQGDLYVIDKCLYDVKTLQSEVGFIYRSKLRKGHIIIRLVDNPFRVTKMESRGNSLIFHSDNINIRFEFLPGQVRSWKYLKNENAPKTLKWEITEENTEGLFINKQIAGRDNQGYKLKNRTPAELESNRWRLDLHTEEARISSKRYYFIETWTGLVKERDSKTRKLFTSKNVRYPILIDQTIGEDIITNNDDGYESGTEWRPNLTSWPYDVNLCGDSAGGAQQSGYRFQTVPVGQGDTIDTCDMIIDVDTRTPAVDWVFDIFGDDVDNAPAWANDSRPGSGFTATTATLQPTVVDNNNQTFDVAPILQEIVNRAGWSANNSIRFAFMNADAVGESYGYIYFFDYNAGAGQFAELSGTYTPAATGSLQQQRYRKSQWWQ